MDNSQNLLFKYFVAGLTARSAAVLAKVNRNTAVLFFHKLQEEIPHLEQKTPKLMCGEIELDEGYFGGVRKGKRRRGAGGKHPYFDC